MVLDPSCGPARPAWPRSPSAGRSPGIELDPAFGRKSVSAPGETLGAAKAWIIRASVSGSSCTNLAATIFFLPEARVIGLLAAYFLRALAQA